MIENLQNCPFCDEKNLNIIQFYDPSKDEIYNSYIRCKNCSCEGPNFNHVKDVILSWNERKLINNDSERQEVLACPFCDEHDPIYRSKPVWENSIFLSYFYCKTCGAIGPPSNNEKDECKKNALENWIKRPKR